MNNQPTPETDEACNEVYAQGVAHIPLVAFMEKLERERDEWRKKAVELCAQRDAAISIGLDAVGQLIDLHHTTPKRERNVEWECRADLLDRNFRKLEDLPDSKDFSCKPPNPA